MFYNYDFFLQGKIKVKAKEEFNITTSKYIRTKDTENLMQYGTFIKVKLFKTVLFYIFHLLIVGL